MRHRKTEGNALEIQPPVVATDAALLILVRNLEGDLGAGAEADEARDRDRPRIAVDVGDERVMARVERGQPAQLLTFALLSPLRRTGGRCPVRGRRTYVTLRSREDPPRSEPPACFGNLLSPSGAVGLRR